MQGEGSPGTRANSWLPARWLSTLVVSGIATVLNWPAFVLVKPGLDRSWQAGIADGFVHHLQWGPALDFTYGPYGFAGFLEPFYLSTTIIAFAFILAVTWLLSTLVVAGTRSQLTLVGAGALAWVVLAMSWVVGRAADFVSVAALGLAICLVRLDRKQPRTALAVALGLLGGFGFLVKLNDGLFVLVVAVLAAIGTQAERAERARVAALALGTFAATLLVGWVVAGQSLTNLASFAHASESLILGYSSNMGTAHEVGDKPLVALGLVAVVAAVMVSALRRYPRGTQIAVGIMVTGWLWEVAKDGFVSGNHFPGFFRLTFMAVALACLLRPPRWAYGVGLVLATVITLSAVGTREVAPLSSADNFVSQLADLARPAHFSSIVASGRQRIIRGEPLPGVLTRMVRGKTIAIEPWEDLVAWALPDARWDPEPVVQSYSAFTVYTDLLDARFLASAKAPERILYWHFRLSFDNRDPYDDPPSTTEAVYCHYAQVAVVGPWQVLGRVADRCGQPRRIGVDHTHFGAVVSVPAGHGDMVVASFSIQPTLLDRLEGLALKTPQTYIDLWVARDERQRPHRLKYSFVTGTASDLHVLSTPVSLGYSGGFAPSTAHRLELVGDGWRDGQGDVTVTFWDVPLAPAPHEVR